MDIEDAVIKVNKNILKRSPGVYCPAFNANTEITVEKVLEINTTTERVIRFEIAIVLPIVPCENISAPQTNVKLVVCVPLRTRWRCHLFHLLSGIGFPSNRYRSDCSAA